MNPTETSTKRRELRTWLPDERPEDAIVAYYMLHHPENRVRLHLRRNAQGRLAGALAECVTGYDLFRPLVVMYAEDDDSLRELLKEAAPRNRAFLLLGHLSYRGVWQEMLNLGEESTYRLYSLSRAGYQPIINVLVTSGKTPTGMPRFEIRSAERAVAYAGINWRSPRYAEVNVYTAPEARGRHWGESVVSALSGYLLEQGLHPLYLADESNPASIGIAERVGYTDTGRRFLFAGASWPSGS